MANGSWSDATRWAMDLLAKVLQLTLAVFLSYLLVERYRENQHQQELRSELLRSYMRDLTSEALKITHGLWDGYHTPCGRDGTRTLQSRSFSADLREALLLAEELSVGEEAEAEIREAADDVLRRMKWVHTQYVLPRAQCDCGRCADQPGRHPPPATCPGDDKAFREDFYRFHLAWERLVRLFSQIRLERATS